MFLSDILSIQTVIEMTQEHILAEILIYNQFTEGNSFRVQCLLLNLIVIYASLLIVRRMRVNFNMKGKRSYRKE